MTLLATAAPVRVPFSDLGAITAEVRDEVDAAWVESLGGSSFVGGPAVERFEREWAAYCGTTEAVAVGNGTDSLQLVLRALGIGHGDEVLVPANTFIATAEAVVLAGAVPRFVDVDPATLLLDADGVTAALTPRTAAVMAVHLYGQMVDMPAVAAVTDAAGVALIEDAAQAHGALCSGRRAGSFGIAGSFSFYPGKNLGAFGDGGAITTSNSALAAKVRSMSQHGRSPYDRYVHDLLGTNSRLDALQAAVLSAKLTRLDAWNRARQDVAVAYRAALGDGPLQLVEERPATPSVHHLTVVRAERRDEVRARLAAVGVETGIHYPVPCHQQGPYRAYADRPLPTVERAAGEVLSLPMFPHLTQKQVGHVCEALAGVAATA